MNKKEAENMLDHEMYLLRINNDCQLWISYTLNNTYVILDFRMYWNACFTFHVLVGSASANQETRKPALLSFY